MRPIYLDFNATTPISPIVFEAMQPYLTEHFGNPSSDHALGRICAHAVDSAREQVATLLGATPDEVVFTAGGTESNNLAIRGAAHRLNGGHVVSTAIEHPAVAAPIGHLAGFTSTLCESDEHGVVLGNTVEQAMTPATKLVSVMHANNETGVVQPIAEISRACRRRGILFHTDAAQSIGKIRTNVQDLGVDLLTIAGHKLYAPKGIGALYIRRGVDLDPVLHGAAHESGLRPGTENVAYIVGLGKAAELAIHAVTETSQRLAPLRDELEARLSERIGAGLRVMGKDVDRLPNTSCLLFPRVSGHELLQSIPELCASTGAACHSGATVVSGTLASMGVSAREAAGMVRLSLGWTTSAEEIEQATNKLVTAWERLTLA